MKKIVRKLELAKTGFWGMNADEISRQDLKDAVETFTAKRPVGIGHEATRKDNTPKFGNVLSVELSADGNSLLGDVEFSEELNRLYTDGKYDGWSVGLPKRAGDGKAYLHHLAFLGATPPKIPGLKDLGLAAFEYADGDTVVVHDFSGAMKEIENTEVRMEEEIKKLKEELAALKELVEKLKAENEKLQAEKKGPEEKNAADGEKGQAEIPAEFADRMKGLEESVKKNRMEAFRAKVSGRVPAGLMGKVEALANELAQSGAEFADTAQGKKGKDALELLADVLGSIPLPVAEGYSEFEFADGGNGEKGAENYAAKIMGAMSGR